MFVVCPSVSPLVCSSRWLSDFILFFDFCFIALCADFPTEVIIQLYIVGFDSISESTMVGGRWEAWSRGDTGTDRDHRELKGGRECVCVCGGRSEKPIKLCDPPRPSEVSPTLPLKRFQCSSD